MGPEIPIWTPSALPGCQTHVRADDGGGSCPSHTAGRRCLSPLCTEEVERAPLSVLKPVYITGHIRRRNHISCLRYAEHGGGRTSRVEPRVGQRQHEWWGRCVRMGVWALGDVGGLSGQCTVGLGPG